MTLRLTGLLTLVAALVLVVAAPASTAGGQRTFTVAGQLTSNDAGTPGDPSDDYSVMTGSLRGKLYTTSGDFRYDPLTGTVIAWGTERFEGCLRASAYTGRANHLCGAGDAGGTLEFAYVYWAQVDPATGALIFGQCVHPVTSGSGDLAGATGTIVMRDTPTRNGEVITTYVGKLKLASGSVKSMSRRTGVKARVAASTAASSLEPSCG